MTGLSENAFGLIENGRVEQELRIRDSDVTVAGGSVRHAVDQLRRRHLLIPLADGQGATEDRNSCGVSLSGRELLDRNRYERYLDVACEVVELRDLFAVFCDDLLEHLSVENAPPAAVCSSVLERWRELFNPQRGALLGSEALAGLLAELRVLEQVAARSPARAVQVWTGPDKARADFTGTRAAVEVKATTGRDRVAVVIHGLRQLDQAQLEDVYLHVEQFETVPTGGDSVPEAVSRLVSAGVDRVGLMRGLATIGYLDSDADAYRRVRFNVLSSRTFRVTAPGFPRLVPAALADPGLAERIFRVIYTIDVTDSVAVPGHLASIEPALDHLLTGPAIDSADQTL
jgi:Putative  PD-(D/E)XK family member, (DUF4420)